MKKIPFTKSMTVAMLCCLFATSLSAQPRHEKPSAEERAKNQTERLNKTVTLTDDQKAKIENVNLSLAKQTDSLFQKNADSREKMKEQIQSQEKTRDAKYKEILTDDQYAEYQKAMTAQKEKIKDKSRQGRRSK